MTDKVVKSEYTGSVTIGNTEIQCAVLPDGTRVLSQRAVGRALGRRYGGSNWKRQEESGGGILPFYLSVTSLRPYISHELMVVANTPIPYRHSKGGGIAQGIKATALPEICDVWLKARDAGALNEAQRVVAQKAEMLMRGLAHVGIIGLVDEATGYQEIRDKKALAAILDKYLRKELAAWAKRFPDEFYQEMFRLKGWKMNEVNKTIRPRIFSQYTNDVVYERLAPGLLEELQKRNPKNEKGYKPNKNHQWLSDELGHPSLAQHIHAVMGLMRASPDWERFYRMLQRAFPKKSENMLLDLGD